MGLEFASLFQDGAVLQRGKILTIWGWSSPLSEVQLRLGEAVGHGFSDDRGKFSIVLPAFENGSGLTLAAKDMTTGDSVSIRDISIGEVWLCSGQSNMEWRMEQCGEVVEPDAMSADFPEIRFFTVERSALLGGRENVNGCWKKISPETVAEVSAVAFGFARKLHLDLGVPIGVITSAFGGTEIESWISRSGLSRLDADPEAALDLNAYAIEAHAPARRGEGFAVGAPMFEAKFPQDVGNLGLERDWPAPEFDESDWAEMSVPGSWQSNGFDSSGVLWFRKRLRLPSDWIGCSLILETGALDKTDITYFNGEEVGRTGDGHDMRFWSQLRSYSVPQALVSSADAVIAVRVNSFAYDGGMVGPAESMRLYPEGRKDEALRLSGEWRYNIEQDYGQVVVSHPRGHHQENSPHILFDNMIKPLAPFALRGFAWYQGEQNTKQASNYAVYLQTLLEDWRGLWAERDLSALIMQLPEYLAETEFQIDSGWAGLREAQRKICQLNNNELSIALGYGDKQNIHPSNKIPVGELLGRSALGEVYDSDVISGGPLPGILSREGPKLVCSFDRVGETLQTSDGEPPNPVFIAGRDGRFIRAQTSLAYDKLYAWHPDLDQPQRLAYAYANNPRGHNLQNSDGLAASPFCLAID